MSDFPSGVSVPTWGEVWIDDTYNAPPLTSDGDRTVTLLSKRDPMHVNSGNTLAWSTLTLPLEADQNPASFEVRGSISLGHGPVGLTIALTDNDGYCPANLLLTVIGTDGAGSSTSEARLTDAVHCGGTLPEEPPQFVALPAIPNDPLDTAPTPPIPWVLGWEHDTKTAYVVWDGVAHDYGPAQDWATDPEYDHDGTTGASRAYRILLIDEDRTFPGDPYSAFAVQLTGFEVEIFGEAESPEPCGRITNPAWNPAGL